MQVIEGLENLSLADSPHGVCVGAFDGFHVGHQYLLSQLCAASADRGLGSAIVTFEPVPAEFFASPSAPPRRLLTKEERIAIAASLCCDVMAILRFDQALASLTARAFVEQILVERLGAKLLLASTDHTMGSDRADLVALTALCDNFGIEVRTAPSLQLGERQVSSSEIRRLLWEGRVEEAAGLLGRHYVLTGTVGNGRGKGTELGFPTANLSLPPDKLLPADGVYAALAYDISQADHRPQACPAAVSIGKAPTFELQERLVEAHLLGQSPELRGHTLRLELLRRLREQRKFASEEDLIRQITLDVEQTRHLAEAVLEGERREG